MFAAGISLSTYIDGLIQDGNYRTFYLVPSILAILMHVCFLAFFLKIRYFFDDITLAFLRKKRQLVMQTEPFKRLVWALGMRVD